MHFLVSLVYFTIIIKYAYYFLLNIYEKIKFIIYTIINKILNFILWTICIHPFFQKVDIKK